MLAAAQAVKLASVGESTPHREVTPAPASSVAPCLPFSIFPHHSHHSGCFNSSILSHSLPSPISLYHSHASKLTCQTIPNPEFSPSKTTDPELPWSEEKEALEKTSLALEKHASDARKAFDDERNVDGVITGGSKAHTVDKDCWTARGFEDGHPKYTLHVFPGTERSEGWQGDGKSWRERSLDVMKRCWKLKETDVVARQDGMMKGKDRGERRRRTQEMYRQSRMQRGFDLNEHLDIYPKCKIPRKPYSYRL
ncbi:hypothetical protein F5887DRAFT_1079571 [Amanita rubescens]|nr:hypothetical protein F5887DRAFT_1079571 [Amanita rubescens]